MCCWPDVDVKASRHASSSARRLSAPVRESRVAMYSNSVCTRSVAIRMTAMDSSSTEIEYMLM